MLSRLGFDAWFEEQRPQMEQSGCSFARVCAVDRGAYRIRDGIREATAELSGRLAYQNNSPSELPCVGDWVSAQYYNDDTQAIIHRVFARKSFLRRKSAGDSIEYQMIAANIDTAFIVQSCHFDFNAHRLERYLVMASDGKVEPVIILTKTDLISPEDLHEKLALISTITKAKVLPLSNISGTGFDAFQDTLLEGKTYCLLGSSGVGKTTLINRLMGKEAYDTKEVSATGEGTHTTTRRQLIMLENKAMLIDTPGMRELGMIGSDIGLNESFEEFVRLAATCRYANCTHTSEPGCSVRAAIDRDELSEDRYENYMKLKKESDFHEMSYLDKRKKDKAFGKFIKNAKKQMKD